MATYRIVLIPEDDGGFSVTVPALPGCFTQGDTREEAVAMAKEAIELHLEALRDDGESAPDDRVEVVTVEVQVPAA
jgi:antitoxin HicB